jgi:hypothetical protein
VCADWALWANEETVSLAGSGGSASGSSSTLSSMLQLLPSHILACMLVGGGEKDKPLPLSPPQEWVLDTYDVRTSHPPLLPFIAPWLALIRDHSLLMRAPFAVDDFALYCRDAICLGRCGCEYHEREKHSAPPPATSSPASSVYPIGSNSHYYTHVKSLGFASLSTDERARLFSDVTGKSWENLLWAATANIDAVTVALFAASALPQKKESRPATRVPESDEQIATAPPPPAPPRETLFGRCGSWVESTVNRVGYDVESTIRVVLNTVLTNLEEWFKPATQFLRRVGVASCPYDPVADASAVAPAGHSSFRLSLQEAIGAVPLSPAEALKVQTKAKYLLSPIRFIEQVVQQGIRERLNLRTGSHLKDSVVRRSVKVDRPQEKNSNWLELAQAIGPALGDTLYSAVPIDALWAVFESVANATVAFFQRCFNRNPVGDHSLSRTLLRPPSEITAELLADLRSATAAADLISSLAVAGVGGGAIGRGEDSNGKVAATVPTIAYSLAAAAVACAQYSVSQRYSAVVGLAGDTFDWSEDPTEDEIAHYVREQLNLFDRRIDEMRAPAADEDLFTIPDLKELDGEDGVLCRLVEVDVGPDVGSSAGFPSLAHGHVFRHYRPALAALQVCAFRTPLSHACARP